MVLQTLRDTHTPRYGELSAGGKTSIVPSLSSSRATYNSFDSGSDDNDDLDHGSIHSRMSTFSRTSMGENHEMSDFKGELLRRRHIKTRSETDKMFFANLARENKKLDDASCADSFANDDDLSDLGEDDQNCPFQVISTHRSNNDKIPPLDLFSGGSPPGSFEDDEDDTEEDEEEDLPINNKGHRHTSSAPVLTFGEFGIKRTNSNDSKSSTRSKSSRGPSHGTMWVKSPENGAKKHLELNFSPEDIGSLSFAPALTGTPSTVSLSSVDSPSRSLKKTHIPGTPEGKKKGHRHRRTASKDFSLPPPLPPSGKEHLPPSGKSKTHSHRRMDSDYSQSSMGHRRMDSDFSQSSLASLHALHVTNIIESEEGEEIELSWDRAPKEPPGRSRRTRSKSPAPRMMSKGGAHSRSSSPSYSPSGRRRSPGSHHRRSSSIELPKANIIIPRVPNLDYDDRSGDGSLPPKPEKPPMPNRPQAHKRPSKGRRRNSAV